MPIFPLSVIDPAYAQRQAADPGTSVWVAASAGSGKTKVLVDRVLNLLLQDVRPERILCLTFTRAAAAEMANRLNQRLLQWATLPESVLAEDLIHLQGRPANAAIKARARRLFTGVLDMGLRIETLHAFCQALLRRFPLEAGVAPHFRVMDECDAAEAIAAARDQVLLRARAETDPTCTAALHTVTAFVHETHFPELIDELAVARSRLQRLLERWNGVDGVVSAIRALLAVPTSETPMNVLTAACAEEACDSPALRRAVIALQGGSTTDIERGNILAVWLDEPAHRIETFDNYLSVFFTSKGTVRKTLITQQAAKAIPMAADALAAEAERLAQVQSRRKVAAVVEATGALLYLGAALLAAYRRYKEVRALLDYDDLILTARRLLEREGQAAWVLYKLDAGLDHLLIDEAQDTSTEQWAIIEILTREFFTGLGSRDGCQTGIARTVFAVGDRKQSIYSFQGAAPDYFEAMRTILRDKVTAARQMWADVQLNISFRSTPAVLQAVDAVFARNLAREGVVLAGEAIHHIAFRAGQAGLVEIWPLVEPLPGKPVAPWEPSIRSCQQETPMIRLAKLVAYRIAAMVDGHDWLDSRRRPVQAGDIMVLMRHRCCFIEELVRRLKNLNVPVAGMDRMIIGEQMAIMDLTALGNVLLLPEDDLTLAAVLKSPLIGLDEEELFTLANPRGSRPLWHALRDHVSADTSFGRAYSWLAGLLAEVDYRRPYELYAYILGPLNGRQRLVARLGPDAEDAIDEFLALALRYEAGHVPSLQGFLHWLAIARVEIRRDLEQSRAEAVRILTVHGAKGLQAPIVFLPDTVQIPTKTPHLLWENGVDGLVFWPPPSRALEEPLCIALRDKMAAARDCEYRRLLYVAMTRAEDRLYVCGWQTRQALPAADCWYNLIRAALAYVGRTETDPFLAASGLLPSAEVLRLANVQEQGIGGTINELPSKLTQQPPPIWAVTEPLPEPALQRPLIPSQLEMKEQSVRSPLGDDKEGHFRRGRLVHRLLQSLPDLPAEERLAAAQRYLDYTAADLAQTARTALAAEVLAVLEHPAAAALFGPGSQAEVPVVGVVGTYVVSGQVDRLMVSKEAVIVADYKTNRPPPQRVENVALIYRRQMAAYRAVLAAIYPDRRIDCVLVWTDGPQIMPLPGALLDSFFPG